MIDKKNLATTLLPSLFALAVINPASAEQASLNESSLFVPPYDATSINVEIQEPTPDPNLTSTASVIQPQAPLGFAKPNFDLSGKITAFGVGISQSPKGSAADNVNFASKGKLRLDAYTQDTGGNRYGGVFELDLRRDKVGSPDMYRAVYAFVSSKKWGTVEFGDLGGALDQTVLDGRDVMGGTGGFDGDFGYFMTSTSGALASLKPLSDTKYATKVVYKTPLWHNFQFALSYTPNSGLFGLQDRSLGGAFQKSLDGTPASLQLLNSNVPGANVIPEGIATAAKPGRPGLARVVEAAASYGFAIGEVGVNLYAGGALGNPTKSTYANYTLKPIKTFQGGLLLDWNKWQLGAGVINNQQSFTPIFTDYTDETTGNTYNFVGTSTATGGTIYNIAISYTSGPHAVAVGYMGSQRKVDGVTSVVNVHGHNTSTTTTTLTNGSATAGMASLTYDYTIAPGWKVFAEANLFRSTTDLAPNAVAGASDPTQGFVMGTKMNQNTYAKGVLLGTSVTF